jgi:uncharacterized protein (DUF927 family)
LVLDEIGQADSKTVGDTVYMLANNQGKGRLRSSTELRRAYEWRLLFLSSGEMTLETKLQEAMKKPMAGMATRFASIPADAGKGLGVFDNLHGFESGHTFCRHFASASKQYYGTAIRAFLAHITAKSAEEIERVIAAHNRINVQPKQCLVERIVRNITYGFHAALSGWVLFSNTYQLRFKWRDFLSSHCLFWHFYCDLPAT